MYEKLDELIISAITMSQSSPLGNPDVFEEARRIALEATPERYIGRVVDGRLKALKRAGRIVYLTSSKSDGKAGWYILQKIAGSSDL